MSSRRAERRLANCALVLAGAVPWLLASGASALSLAILAVGGVWMGFERAGWLGGPRAIRLINWQADGRWVLLDARGSQFEGVLRSEMRLTSGFVWLRWDAAGIRSMLLTPGDVAEPLLRRLCVRLRLTGPGCFEPVSAISGS